jgi:hypothetical protein
LGIPLDLSDWVGRYALACLSLEAATEVGAPAFRELFRDDPSARARANTLLALITYCYAAGIFASDEIELRAMDDPMVQYLAGHAPPEWHRLRAFRRQWHETIHDCLVRVFTQAWARLRLDSAEWPMDPPAFESDSLVQDGNLPPGCFPVEVERRINRAILLDSMCADD